jgi:hypothetical protein
LGEGGRPRPKQSVLPGDGPDRRAMYKQIVSKDVLCLATRRRLDEGVGDEPLHLVSVEELDIARVHGSSARVDHYIAGLQPPR